MIGTLVFLLCITCFPALKGQQKVISEESVVIDGAQQTKKLSSNNKLIVGENGVLTLRNITLTNVTNKTLLLTHKTSRLILDNCTLTFPRDYTLSMGTISVYGLCLFNSTNDTIILYESDEQTIVHRNSTLALGPNVTWYYRPPAKRQDRLKLATTSSSLLLMSATIRAGMSGMQLTTGRVCIAGTCHMHADNTNNKEHALTLGSGRSAKDNVTIVMLDDDSKIKVDQPLFQEQRVEPFMPLIDDTTPTTIIALCGLAGLMLSSILIT